ncbi:MAG: hypothetical protein H8D78_03685 [Chloroflexi bacterium]|nr:hypothetical protein [Chloroflexota bacterium]
MAKSNILNLDALIPEPRFVQLDGEQHQVQVDTVEMGLKMIRARDELVKAADAGEGAQAERAVLLVAEAVPTIPESRIRQLPMAALTALLSFIFPGAEVKGGGEEAGEEPGE